MLLCDKVHDTVTRSLAYGWHMDSSLFLISPIFSIITSFIEFAFVSTAVCAANDI